jgi:hypothetical protein
MNCENCKVKIGAEFVFALKNNKCPACGESIMATEKLASFLSLQALLRANFENIDAEKVSSMVVANFHLVQIFNGVGEKSTVSSQLTTVSVVHKDMTDEQRDAEYKKKQLAKSKETLKKLRDEAMNEAIAGSWGMKPEDDENSENEVIENDKVEIVDPDFFEDDLDARKLANEEKMRARQEKILSGGAGFKRT